MGMSDNDDDEDDDMHAKERGVKEREKKKSKEIASLFWLPPPLVALVFGIVLIN